MKHFRQSNTAHSKSGFTLLEILIAIALLALLASVAINNFTGIFGDNQEKVARFFVTGSSDLALSQYRMDVGNFPTTEQGLDALLKAPASKENRWRGPYIKESPIDPWGNPYQYRFPGSRNISGNRSFDIWSLGQDGVESGDDIGNWVSQ